MGGAAVVGIYRLGFPNAVRTANTSTVAVTTTTTTNSNTNNNTSSSKVNSNTNLKSIRFFQEVESKLKQEGASMTSKIKAIIGFEVSLPSGEKVSYAIDLKNAPGSVGLNDGSKLFLFSKLS